MARTPTQVVSDYQDEYAVINPSIDATKGPVLDHTITPNSRFISEVEERQDRTDRLSSADFTAAATTEELERMASTVGAGSSQGAVATCRQIFGSFSRPKGGSLIPIPKGTLVGSLDGTFIYQTTEAAEIDGDFPDLFYNRARRTYEVGVNVEAVAVGSAYNLPPFRIRKLIRPITGIDFTENRVAAVDGLEPGGSDTLVLRAQSKFVGQEQGTPNGLAASVLETFEDALSVIVITSTDYVLFRRLLSDPGLDVYYSGEVIKDADTTFVGTGGETEIPLESQPVTEVTEVLVNGLPVDYTVVVDEEPPTAGSTEDTTHILLGVALAPGSSCVVRYKFDSLASLIANVFTGQRGMFNTNTLIRRSIRKNPRIVLDAVASSGFNPFTLKTSLEAAVTLFFETNEHGASYMPSIFEEFLFDEVVGLASKPQVSVFNVADRALLDVEPIILRANEIMRIDSDLVTVSVK